MQFATIEEAISEIQEGRMVIIVDDEDRENEGDLMIAAEKVTRSGGGRKGDPYKYRSVKAGEQNERGELGKKDEQNTEGLLL